MPTAIRMIFIRGTPAEVSINVSTLDRGPGRVR
jgi:hypothetical protein